MAKNNKKVTWKAIIAVILVMASLFAMSSLISAGLVEDVFSEVWDLMTYSSSNGNVHIGPHIWMGSGEYKYCKTHGTKTEGQICIISSCDKEYWASCPYCSNGN